jgi:hypothetical protein
MRPCAKRSQRRSGRRRSDVTQESGSRDEIESAMADVKRALQDIEEKEAAGELAVQAWEDYAAALDRWQIALLTCGFTVKVVPAD